MVMNALFVLLQSCFKLNWMVFYLSLFKTGVWNTLRSPLAVICIMSYIQPRLFCELPFFRNMWKTNGWYCSQCLRASPGNMQIFSFPLVEINVKKWLNVISWRLKYIRNISPRPQCLWLSGNHNQIITTETQCTLITVLPYTLAVCCFHMRHHFWPQIKAINCNKVNRQNETWLRIVSLCHSRLRDAFTNCSCFLWQKKRREQNGTFSPNS